MRFYQLTTNFIVHQIDKIIYQQDRGQKAICSLEMQNAIREEQERIKQAEYKTISKIIPLPKGIMVEYESRITGYTPIGEHNAFAKTEKGQQSP